MGDALKKWMDPQTIIALLLVVGSCFVLFYRVQSIEANEERLHSKLDEKVAKHDATLIQLQADLAYIRLRLDEILADIRQRQREGK